MCRGELLHPWFWVSSSLSQRCRVIDVPTRERIHVKIHGEKNKECLISLIDSVKLPLRPYRQPNPLRASPFRHIRNKECGAPMAWTVPLKQAEADSCDSKIALPHRLLADAIRHVLFLRVHRRVTFPLLLTDVSAISKKADRDRGC